MIRPHARRRGPPRNRTRHTRSPRGDAAPAGSRGRSALAVASAAAAVFAALAVAPATAHAEEGLFIARLGGGVTSTPPATGDAPLPGGGVSGAIEYGLAERAGVALELSSVFHPGWATLALAGGVHLLPVSSDWARVYFFAGPAFLLAWPRDGGGRTRADLAARAALGLEWLWLWGFGCVLQLGATLPVGLGPALFAEGASADVTAGLFMEF